MAATPSFAQLPLLKPPPRTPHDVQACEALAKKLFVKKFGAGPKQLRSLAPGMPSISHGYESHYSAKYDLCTVLTEESFSNGDKYYMLSGVDQSGKIGDIYGVYSFQPPTLLTCWVGLDIQQFCKTEMEFMTLVEEQTGSI